MFNFSKNTNPAPAEKPTLKKDVVILDYLKNIEKDINDYKALYIKISQLENPNLKTVQKQGLLDTFDNLIRKDNGEIFSLPNDDLVVAYRAKAKEEIQACIIKIRFILHDDKLIKDNFDLEAAGFLKFFSLRSDMAEFQRLITQEASKQAPDKKEPTVAAGAREPKLRTFSNAAVCPKKELTPYMLGKLTKTLSMADFSSLIRRQAVCAVIGKSVPQMLFEEVYVSIADLRDTLLPDVDLTANPWLFQYLTETLDKRVLASISNHDDGSLTSNFSLNLNVSTVLSDEFLEFDEDINASMRSTIVLELQLLDIFSDIKAFILAKTFVQSRGYKICIDGITVDKLKYLNREQLDADLIKIIWHPTFMDVIHEDKHFMDYVNKAERAKMILCRVDEPQAVEVGNSLGINLYQGRYIQRLLSRRSSKQTIFTIRR
ncbi:MAG: hypothetical protein SO314_07115 [Alphaproteobacteria bacterium]|nr:hypothetical protein [Alphaproteobacteria bacterium]